MTGMTGLTPKKKILGEKQNKKPFFGRTLSKYYFDVQTRHTRHHFQTIF